MKKKFILLGCVGLMWIMAAFLFELGTYMNNLEKQLLGVAYGFFGLICIAMVLIIGYIFVFCNFWVF